MNVPYQHYEIPEYDPKAQVALRWLLDPRIAPLTSLPEDVQILIGALSSGLPPRGMDLETQALLEARDREGAEREKAQQIASYNRAVALSEEIGTEGRHIAFTSADTITAKPVRWLWQHRMPLGEITLLAGRAGLGKSTFGSHLTAAVTTGTLEPGCYEGQPKDVLIFATEDAWEYTIVPRLIAAGADMPRVHRAHVTADTENIVPFNATLDADRLVRDTQAAGLDVGLIIFDPLVSVLHGRKRNDGDAIRPALEKLKTMAEAMGVNVLALVHFNKGGNNQSALERVTGSGEFGNVVRSGIGVAENPDDSTVVLSNIKHNLAPSDLPSLTFRIDSVTVQTPEGPTQVGRVLMLGETASTVEQLMREESDIGSRAGEAKTWLREFLEEHGQTPSAEVLKAAAAEGHSRSAVQRARKSLNVQVSRLPISPPVTTWALPVTRPFVPG